METIGSKEFAELFGVSLRRVQQLVTQRVLTPAGHGLLKCPEAFREFVAHRVKSEIDKLPKPGDETQRARDAKAEDLELRVSQRRGTMVAEAKDVAVAVFDLIVGPFKADLMGIPAQVTKDITLRRVIESRIDGAFNAAADRANAAAGVARTGGIVPPTSRTGNARRVGTAKPRVSAKRRQAGAA